MNFVEEVHHVISLLYVSKFLRQLILIRYGKYYKLTIGVCTFGFWKRKLSNLAFELFSELYSDFDIFFNFEVWVVKLTKTMCHLSLFFVCMHFFHMLRK